MRRFRSLQRLKDVCLGHSRNSTYDRRAASSCATIIFAVMYIAPDKVAFAASKCIEPRTGTDRVPILSPPLGKAVVGKGRLQFYSAPNLACRMNGVFVIPGDNLVAYAQTRDGWTSVTYFGGSSPSGWVRSERLRTTGTMGPNQ